MLYIAIRILSRSDIYNLSVYLHICESSVPFLVISGDSNVALTNMQGKKGLECDILMRTAQIPAINLLPGSFRKRGWGSCLATWDSSECQKYTISSGNYFDNKCFELSVKQIIPKYMSSKLALRGEKRLKVSIQSKFYA